MSNNEFSTIQKRESRAKQDKNSKKIGKKILLFSYKKAKLSDIVLS